MQKIIHNMCLCASIAQKLHILPALADNGLNDHLPTETVIWVEIN